MQVPRPLDSLGCNRCGEAPLIQLELCSVDGVAALNQAERQAPGPRPIRSQGVSCRSFDVGLVSSLELFG